MASKNTEPEKEPVKKAAAKSAEKTSKPTKTTAKSKTTPKKKAPKKPKDMTKVQVTTSDKATAALSAQLDKVPREKEAPAAGKKKSIAKRTVALKTCNWPRILSLLALIPLGLLFLLFTFVIQGYSFSALVCACLMGLILFYNLIPLVGRKFPKFAKVVKRIVTVILCIGLIVVAVTECIIIKASFGSPEENVDYVVVLGAKVRTDGPSVSLQNRIDAAYDYLTAHPNAIAIVSGGMGPDEPITEAQCMYDHLVAMGIDAGRVWMEDKATSTWENLHFSLDLIEEKTGLRPEKLGVISSEYHLFRASLFTKACGVEFVGIPAHTTRLSQMVNHFMREVAGVWHYILLGGQYHD